MQCAICGKACDQAFLHLGGYCGEGHRRELLGRHRRLLDQLRREELRAVPEALGVPDFERLVLGLAVRILDAMTPDTRRRYQELAPHLLDPLEMARELKARILSPSCRAPTSCWGRPPATRGCSATAPTPSGSRSRPPWCWGRWRGRTSCRGRGEPRGGVTQKEAGLGVTGSARGPRPFRQEGRPMKSWMNANPKGVPAVRTVRCRPARRRVGYQVVYFDAGGRQVAWAPNGPQRTRGQALRHLSPSALPRDVVGYAVVRLVTVETVVRQKLLEGEGAAGAAERRAR